MIPAAQGGPVGALIGRYDPLLVLLSVGIAVLASYAALALADRVAALSGRLRAAWLAGGAMALGIGMWAMHFVGMLSLRLPLPMAYRYDYLLLALAVAVLTAGLALLQVNRAEPSHQALLGGAALLGLAFVAMHGLGMAALHTPARITYRAELLLASVAIAVGVSLTALGLAWRARAGASPRARWLQGAAALGIGAAMAGMHYTALAAARFVPAPELAVVPPGAVLATPGIVAAVIVATVSVVGVAVAGAIGDRYLQAQAAQLALVQASERALRESEARFRALVEQNQVGITEVDPTGRFVLVNRRFCEMLGRSEEELLRLRLHDVTHPDDVAASVARVHALLEGGPPFVLEQRYLRREGGVVWSSTSVSAVREPDGRIRHLVAAITDITERKRSEEALKLQALVLESMTEGVSLADEEGTILYTNPAEDRIFGYARGELVGQHVSAQNAYSPEENRRIVAAVIEQLMARGAWQGEFRNVRKDGTPFVTRARITALDLGGRRHWVCVQEDITEQKRTAELLHQRERELAALVEHSPDVIARFDRELRHLYVSPAIERATGLPPEHFLGRTAGEQGQPAAFVERWNAGLRRVFESVAPVDLEFDFPSPGGHAWYQTRLVPEFDADGRVATVLAVTRDVSEWRQAEERLREAQKLEAVGRLAGGIAHDLNNMLVAILGYCDFVIRTLGPEDRRREDLGQIAKAADRSATLVRQLLAFARRDLIRPRPLDLNATVRDAEGLVRSVLGENVELVPRLSPELGLVLADAGRMEQVLLNLALNARDAMPQGGRLVIETAETVLGPEYVRRHRGVEVPPGRYVQLTVSDTGHGMDRETLARAFEPFFTTKPVGQGTGLGLATVYGIVKQAGGLIWAYSEVGEGTAFKIYLPAVERAAGPPTPVSERPGPEGGSETVLVVEDEPAVAESMRRTLVEHGYTVLSARNGAEALELLEEDGRPVHLVLSDVVMPVLAGHGLAERLPRVRPGLPVLFTSGFTPEDVVRRGLLPPSSLFLQKPFAPETLLQKVREALGSAGRAI